MPKVVYFSKLALVGGAVGALLGGGWAHAQAPAPAQAVSSEQRTFNIAPEPLSQAALHFSDQAGVQLVLGAPVSDGLRANAVQGRLTIADALNRLLAGSGLTWRYLNAHTITIERKVAAAPSGVRTLAPVMVEGAQSGFAELDGFGAGAGGNGSSDPTATESSRSFTTNATSVVSGVPESLKETAQTVNVVTHEQIEQQNLTDLTSALNYVPGVTLLSSGQGNTQFISRGFNVSTFQVDGGAPLIYSNSALDSPQRTPDLSEYDHVEVLHGSDALTGGVNGPGGVVNLERKRPLDHDQLVIDGEAGSWDNERLEMDATGPLGLGGHLRGRVDVVYQDRDFFYDVAHQTMEHVYAVVEADLGPDTLVRVGGSYGNQTNPGDNLFGLPRYPNGDDIHLSSNTCLCASWNKDDSKSTELFAAIEHRFNDDWRLKIDATETTQFDKQVAAIVDGPVNKGQNLASYNGPDDLNYTLRQYNASAVLNGDFSLFGLKQQIVTGFQYARRTFGATLVQPLEGDLGEVNVFDVSQDVFGSEPASGFPTINTGDGGVSTQSAAFINLILQPTKNLHIRAGLRYEDDRTVTAESTSIFGINLADVRIGSHDYGQVTPSINATYDLTHDVSAYASFAQVVQPQGIDLTPDLKPLPDSAGSTYEVGLKAAPRQGKLNIALGIFYTEQDHQALLIPATALEPVGCCYEDAGTIKAAGLELNVQGELAPGWQFSGGYTYDNTRYSKAFYQQLNAGGSNAVGTPYLTQQPKNQVKLFTSYVLPGRFNRWTVGSGLRVESARFTQGTVCSLPVDLTGFCLGGVESAFNFTQSLYAVLDLRVAYRFSKHWDASLNLTNVTNTRYYATAGSSVNGNFYGEPMAFMFALKGHY